MRARVLTAMQTKMIMAWPLSCRWERWARPQACRPACPSPLPACWSSLEAMRRVAVVLVRPRSGHGKAPVDRWHRLAVHRLLVVLPQAATLHLCPSCRWTSLALAALLLRLAPLALQLHPARATLQPAATAVGAEAPLLAASCHAAPIEPCSPPHPRLRPPPRLYPASGSTRTARDPSRPRRARLDPIQRAQALPVAVHGHHLSHPTPTPHAVVARPGRLTAASRLNSRPSPSRGVRGPYHPPRIWLRRHMLAPSASCC